MALVSYYIGRETEDVTLAISDLSGRNRRTLTVDGSLGIHRARWDLAFDPQPLTAEQRAQVNDAFDRAIAMSGFFANRVRAARARFEAASTPLEERAAAAVLRNPFFDLGLGPEFDVPVAGPGSYLLTLTVGPEVFAGTLRVREDPLGMR